MAEAKRVLVVDDDAAVASMLSRALARHGFLVDAARTADEALDKAAAAPYDAALLARDARARRGQPRRRSRVTPSGDDRRLPDRLPELAADRGAKKAGRAVFTKPVVVQEIADYLNSELG